MTKKNLLIDREDLNKVLAKLATKDDLKRFATKDELAQLEEILRTEIRLTAQETKDEIREEIKLTKSEILNVLDSFLKEIETSQEDRNLTSHQLSDHEDRLVILEQKVVVATI